jgi:hypothetical protein
MSKHKRKSIEQQLLEKELLVSGKYGHKVSSPKDKYKRNQNRVLINQELEETEQWTKK